MSIVFHRGEFHLIMMKKATCCQNSLRIPPNHEWKKEPWQRTSFPFFTALANKLCHPDLMPLFVPRKVPKQGIWNWWKIGDRKWRNLNLVANVEPLKFTPIYFLTFIPNTNNSYTKLFTYYKQRDENLDSLCVIFTKTFIHED